MEEVASVESYFGSEYMDLAGALQDYLVELLDQVNSTRELKTILDRCTEPNQFDDLFLLNFSSNHEEKKFVAHPLCQQVLGSVWYRGVKFYEFNFLLRLLVLLGIICSYPFLMLAYIIWPSSRLGKIAQRPFIKFFMGTLSSCTFLILVFIATLLTSPVDEVKLTDYPALKSAYVDFVEYIHFRPQSTYTHEIENNTQLAHLVSMMDLSNVTQLRKHRLLFDLWMIQLILLIGFMVREMKQVGSGGLVEYLQSYYNWVDAIGLSLYLGSFSVMWVAYFKVQYALEYFEYPESWQRLVHGDPESAYWLYWMNSDRWHWDYSDPMHLRDALYACANVLSFLRMSQLLVINGALGPMQISLGKMINNIVVFCIILFFIFIGFNVGIINLYWYYDPIHRSTVEGGKHSSSSINGQEKFGNGAVAIGSMIWAIFGLAESDWYSLENYGDSWVIGQPEGQGNIIQDFGMLLWALYHLALVIVMMNMLIAMMAKSFDDITNEGDVEWKFARTSLFIEYIGEGGVLPSPFNLIPNIPYLISGLFSIAHKKVKEVVKDTDYRKPPIIYRNIYGFEVWRCSNYTVDKKELEDQVDEIKLDEAQFQTIQGPIIYRPARELNFAEVIKRIVKRYVDQKRLPDTQASTGEISELKSDFEGFQNSAKKSFTSIEHQFLAQDQQLREVRIETQELRTAISSMAHDIRSMNELLTAKFTKRKN